MESPEAAVVARYEQLIEGWNSRDGRSFAEPFADAGATIGFDGSVMNGREEIASETQRIFDDHETASYVAKVKGVDVLSADVAVLRAVVGMIPEGRSELDPDKNAHQTVVAVRKDEDWRIVLLQNTPAQFHGRPGLVEELTAELQRVAESASSPFDALRWYRSCCTRALQNDHQKKKKPSFALLWMRLGIARSGSVPAFMKTTNSTSPGIRQIIEARPLPLPSSLSPPLLCTGPAVVTIGESRPNISDTSCCARRREMTDPPRNFWSRRSSSSTLKCHPVGTR